MALDFIGDHELDQMAGSLHFVSSCQRFPRYGETPRIRRGGVQPLEMKRVAAIVGYSPSQTKHRRSRRDRPVYVGLTPDYQAKRIAEVPLGYPEAPHD